MCVFIHKFHIRWINIQDGGEFSQLTQKGLREIFYRIGDIDAGRNGNLGVEELQVIIVQPTKFGLNCGDGEMHLLSTESIERTLSSTYTLQPGSPC